MKKSLGLAALLPGFLSLDAQSVLTAPETLDDLELGDTIVAPLNTSTPLYLAGHRSHSSHASHGSHRSSAGGVMSKPRAVVPAVPTLKAPAPSDPLGRPSTPSTTAPKKSVGGKLEQRALVVRKVQAMLMAHGFYMGKIDGIMGPETRTAILQYRLSNNIAGGLEIDSSLLNSLGILAQ